MFVVLYSSATASHLRAQTTYNWSPIDTNFGSSSNWSPGGGPPGELDTAVFNTGSNSTATFNYSPVNASLQHQSGNTIFRPSGTNSTYTLNGASTISGGSLTINPDGIFKLDVRFSGLTLLGNSTFNIYAGEVSNAGVLNVGNGSAATINVDGSTAKFNSAYIGQNTLGGSTNGHGTLTFSNGATGSMAGSLRIGGGPSSGGYLDVYGGSTFSLGDASVGFGGTVGQQGRIIVDGSGSTITQTGSSTLVLGKTTNNGVVQSEIRAQNGGIFNTGTGLTTVNTNGVIEVNGGTFNANGDVNVNGGSIALSFGNFNLASGRTLTASNDAQIDLGFFNVLSGGTNWNITSGSDLIASVIDIGSNLDGSSGGVTNVTIDGNGSSLTTGSALSFWASNGDTAAITVRNGAAANVGAIDLARSFKAGTTGTISVESGAEGGATMTLGSLFVARNGGATTTGTITVTGAGSALTQTGSSTLTLGHATSGSATLNVLDGGTFTTGTGTTTVNATGAINIGSFLTSGTFNANGDINVDGGSITRTSGSFKLASGRTLTASNGAQIDLGGSTTLSDGTTWNILSGADLFNAGFIGVSGSSGAETTVTVDGAGSSWSNAPGSNSSWGNDGHRAIVSFRNGGEGSFGNLALAGGAIAGSTAIINVESGASLSVGNLDVAEAYTTDVTGTVNVSGFGSSINASRLHLGSSNGPANVAQLNIADGGTFIAGTGGTLLRTTGTINIDGGFANLGLLDRQGGTVNFHSGSLSYGGDLTVGSGGLLGNGNVTLESNRQVALTGTTTVNSFRTLKLDGGSFSTGELVVQNGGVFDFQKGTLGLTGASGLTVGSGGALGDVIQVGNQQTYNISHTATVANDGVLSVANGGRFNANTLNNFGEVIMGGNLARITTSPQTTFNNHGLLSGAGRIDGDLYNHAGGVIELESGKRLAFTDNISNLAGGRIIGRGQLVAPSIDNYGQMLFSGGFTDIQAPITGFSDSQMIITGGSTTSILGDVEIRGGAELRISEFSNGVFFDHVQLRDGALLTGDGNAFFEGSLGIGNSPSRQEFNFNVTLGATSELIMEIAGTDPFLPEFDQFVFLKNLNLQGGALTVDLIGLNEGDPNYLPLAGDSFRFIEVSGNWTGTFGTLNLPTLADGLTWNTTQLYSHGSLSVSAIPEPGSGLMLIAMAAAFVLRRHRRTMGALQ